jgi:hypothetical protein
MVYYITFLRTEVGVHAISCYRFVNFQSHTEGPLPTPSPSKAKQCAIIPLSAFSKDSAFSVTPPTVSRVCQYSTTLNPQFVRFGFFCRYLETFTRTMFENGRREQANRDQETWLYTVVTYRNQGIHSRAIKAISLPIRKLF